MDAQPSCRRQGKGTAVTLPASKPMPEVLRLQLLDDLAPEQLELMQRVRPRTRGDCANGPRPCPWVGCRQHLFLEVSVHGSIQLLHPGLEPGDLKDTCALDVAERKGVACEEAAAALGLTRERARQIEMVAMDKVAEHREALRAVYLDEGERLPAVAPSWRKPRINTCSCGQRHVWIKGTDCCTRHARAKIAERKRLEREQKRLRRPKLRVGRCYVCGGTARGGDGTTCSLRCTKALERRAGPSLSHHAPGYS